MPAEEAYEAGVWGQSPRAALVLQRRIAGPFKARVPTYPFGLEFNDSVPTVSHPKGGSRRATALLPGATPAQANMTSACVIRIGDTHLRG